MMKRFTITGISRRVSESRKYFPFALLCIYFILYQANRYFGLLPFATIFKYLSTYLFIGIVIFFIAAFYFQSRLKASIYTTFSLCIFFFFGAYHDTIKSTPILSPIVSYKFNLPAITLMLGVAIVAVKKIGISGLAKITSFSFTILWILALWELLTLGYKAINHHEQANDLGDINKSLSRNHIPCDTCKKPDIYFLLFDGFTSSECLQEEFKYNNKGLDSFLRNRGFYIVDKSQSNYAVTTLSMASTLNMNYLNSTKFPEKLDITLLMQGCETMYDNELIPILKKEGYIINNYGVFDLKGYNLKRTYFDHVSDDMIHQQTLAGRIKKDILWNFYTKNIFTGEKRTSDHQIRNRDKHIHDFITNNIQRVHKSANQNLDNPVFTYCHVMMPHEPFYFDKDGELNKNADSLSNSGAEGVKMLYLNQLIYAGKVVQQLVDSILQKTKGESVIIIQGDHGFRDYESMRSKNNVFKNLNCYYFPDRDYRFLKKNTSPVNTFRIVANKYFSSNYPLLKDTSIYIKHMGFLFERNYGKK